MKTETVDIKPEALTGQAIAFAQLDKVLSNISSKLAQPTFDKLPSKTDDDEGDIPVEL